MAKEKNKKRKISQTILSILILVCFLTSAYFLYNYVKSNGDQWKNSEVALQEANTALKKKTDYRKKKPTCSADKCPVIGKIKIDGLTNDLPIIEGEDLNLSMAFGVGHIDHTPLPGTYTGQPAFSAHRETFFNPLKDAKVGDTVTVYMPYGTYRYKISKSIIVNPDEGDKIYTTEGINKERIVLITCYPFESWSSPSKRIAFFADLIE